MTQKPVVVAPSLPWVIGISGASGMPYAQRLLGVIQQEFPALQLEVVLSDSALRVLHEEAGIATSTKRISAELLCGINARSIRFHDNKDIGASIASGSYRTAGMVVVPCSMNSIAAIANGLADSLLLRAADVTMKEGRRLILVPRETPLSTIHLENMLRLSRAGARIVPAMPGFYHQPQSIAEVVDMMVLKILDQMDLALDLVERWGNAPAVKLASVCNASSTK